MSKIAGVVLVSLASFGVAQAVQPLPVHLIPSPGPAVRAPEIDPAGMMSALTLLAGGLAVIRGRRNSKK